jgi:type I restriction enzyme S subunit
MRDWIQSTIGTQVTLQRGIDITKINQRLGAIPVISSGGISSFHDTPSARGPGVILGRKGVVGSVYYVEGDYWPHDTTLWVKDFHGNQPRFVYYFFKWMAPRLATMDVGSANPTLNRNHVHPIPVAWPNSLAVQHAISSLLGALDDKIDLNRRMNETLKAVARAIFKDWFVDFGPTRTKMEGRPPYLDPDLWALFPDRLDAEGKPEGWEVTTLQAVVSELRRGISPSYAEIGGVRVLNQKCIRDRSVSFGPARRHDAAKRSISGRELMIGDVLINSTGVGTLGRAAQIWDVDELTVVDSHVTVVRADPQQVSTCYLGLDLTGREHEIEALGEGSTGQTELSRVRLGGMSILLPGAALNAHLETVVHPLLQRMESNRRESLSLADLRDFLLPKLMSGKIRVRDAESLLGAVA